MYKFSAQNALIENMYLLISIFKQNQIIPIFVFDGKSPPEKRELINQRNRLKQDAEKKYKELTETIKNAPVSSKPEMELEMEALKKKFIRIKEADVLRVKSLMYYYGASYCDADGEADKLCVYMVKNGTAWACLSDDMDMFVYGCSRVLRHISLLKHSVILYDLETILTDLNITMSEFRQITVISGTDYNINQTTSLSETMKWFYQYKKEYAELEAENEPLFYKWLLKFTKYIKDYEDLIYVHNMFYVDDLDNNLASRQLHTSNLNMSMLKGLLRTNGFIFA
jgi:5'-3' exonuclease